MNTLKDLREQKHLTQKQVANMLDVTKEYVSMIERAERTPSDKIKEKLCILYDKSISEIFLAIKQTQSLTKRKCIKEKNGA